MNKCAKATNNCGALVTCPPCANALCGADGKPSTCSCPPRPLALNQFGDGAGHTCYATTSTSCGTETFQATIAKLYPGPTDGVVRLYRCNKGIAFTLTTQTGCNGLAGYVVDSVVGACAAAPACGALLLHRYYNNANDDFVHGFGAAPPGYIPFGDVCYAWPP